MPETTAAATTVGVLPDLEASTAAEVLRWAGDAFGDGLVVIELAERASQTGDTLIDAFPLPRDGERPFDRSVRGRPSR